MIFDSHTHLNAEQFNEEIPETIARAHEARSNEKWQLSDLINLRLKSHGISQEYDGIYSIIGWHPTEAGILHKRD